MWVDYDLTCALTYLHCDVVATPTGLLAAFINHRFIVTISEVDRMLLREFE